MLTEKDLKDIKKEVKLLFEDYEDKMSDQYMMLRQRMIDLQKSLDIIRKNDFDTKESLELIQKELEDLKHAK